MTDSRHEMLLQTKNFGAILPQEEHCFVFAVLLTVKAPELIPTKGRGNIFLAISFGPVATLDIHWI